jgi:hypothetical protein
MLHSAGRSDVVWGNLGRRRPSPKLAWPEHWILPYHTDSVDLSAESKDSAADRMPKARQHTVRARLFVGKQVPSFWGTLPMPKEATSTPQPAYSSRDRV